MLGLEGRTIAPRIMSIDEYVKSRMAALKKKVSSFRDAPRLLIIQLNDDPGSSIYVRGKMRDAEKIGVRATLCKLSLSTGEDEVLALIKKANDDPSIHGIIVQFPLPQSFDLDLLWRAIDPRKDVDGFNPLTHFVSCTGKGIIDYLKAIKFPIRGKNVVVIGRSALVGRPIANLFLNEDGNVTVLHSKTLKKDLDRYLAHADIIVSATGKRWLISNQKLKKDAAIIDVGISLEDGKLYGDVKPGRNVAMQTPVPGGVGRLTRLALMENLIKAYEGLKGLK